MANLSLRRTRRLLQIGGEVVRHPLRAAHVTLVVAAGLTFMAFWQARGLLQVLLFPVALPALAVLAWGARLRR